MGVNYTQKSVIEIMNEILSAVRDYYDSDYAYYAERSEDEILTVYEWCADGKEWMREQIRMSSIQEAPRWMKEEILDPNDSDYSVSYPLGEGVMGILAVVGVHRGGCGLELLHTTAPFMGQILAMKKAEKKQEYLSYHDEMTGLLNRNSFVEYTEALNVKELESAGAVSVDINSLKKFNLEFGHDYGDEVVRRVAELLEEYFKGDHVFRLTGDEYLILCENIPYEKFITQVHDLHTKLENISLDLTSVGYAWEKVDIDPDRMIRSAEEMMHQEKQDYYRRERKEDHRPIIEQDLLDDIRGGRYIVCLDPEFDIQTDSVSGASAVIRYHHKDLGVIDPKKYLDILEQTKLSYHLDIYIFEQVCRTLQNWEQREIPLIPISVPLSGVTLRRDGIAEELIHIARKYRVPTEYLLVEISDADSQLNQEMIAETINKIRKGNIRVVLNRFGSKQSSLSSIAIMEFDVLKLDRSIVEDIVGNHRCQVVAQAILDTCRRLGVHSIASGVVTQDQLNVLKELGYQNAEGVLFNKPITVETFEVRYLGQ